MRVEEVKEFNEKIQNRIAAVIANSSANSITNSQASLMFASQEIERCSKKVREKCLWHYKNSGIENQCDQAIKEFFQQVKWQFRNGNLGDLE